MKLFFTTLASLFVLCGFAQQRQVAQAVITTTTNVIAPEDEDVSQIGQGGGGGGGGGMRFANMMDGETKSTTTVKGGMTKTTYRSESFRGTVYRDNTAGRTSTVFEIMGNKMGMYIDDADSAQMRKSADSMMKARGMDSTIQRQMRPRAAANASVVYTEDSKKIAGYTAKKAYIVRERLLGKDSMIVWYTPDIKIKGLSATGGTAGLGNMMQGANNNFDLVDGFILAYDQDMPRGRKMEVKVTKIELDKDIADKEFELPKDVEFRSMKEMQQGGGGMFRMTRPN